jgi:hypothetical protein
MAVKWMTFDEAFKKLRDMPGKPLPVGVVDNRCGRLEVRVFTSPVCAAAWAFAALRRLDVADLVIELLRKDKLWWFGCLDQGAGRAWVEFVDRPDRRVKPGDILYVAVICIERRDPIIRVFTDPTRAINWTRRTFRKHLTSPGKIEAEDHSEEIASHDKGWLWEGACYSAAEDYAWIEKFILDD